MSFRAPSLLALLAALQQHGLTYAQLAAFLAACQARHSGQILFQVAQGRIRSLEVQASQPQRQRSSTHD